MQFLLMRLFPGPKSCIRQEPSVNVFTSKLKNDWKSEFLQSLVALLIILVEYEKRLGYMFDQVSKFYSSLDS